MILVLASVAAAVAWPAVAVTTTAGGGTITADGSSTVGPYVTAAAEGFQDETGTT